jgi:hypothetical protein
MFVKKKVQPKMRLLRTEQNRLLGENFSLSKKQAGSSDGSLKT